MTDSKNSPCKFQINNNLFTDRKNITPNKITQINHTKQYGKKLITEEGIVFVHNVVNSWKKGKNISSIVHASISLYKCL